MGSDGTMRGIGDRAAKDALFRRTSRGRHRLSSDRVAELWAAMRAVAGERVAGLDCLAAAYLGERDGIELIQRDELAARWAVARSWCSTSDPNPSSRPVTSPTPARFRSSYAGSCAPSPKGTEVVAADTWVASATRPDTRTPGQGGGDDGTRTHDLLRAKQTL
jgi:hypothetical protein